MHATTGQPAAPAAPAAPATPAAPAAPALRLDSSLQIKDVEAARQLLTHCLEGDSPIRIDVSRITAVDTAGVQLLLAFRRAVSHAGMSVEYCGESPPLLHALTLLGLTEAVLGRGTS
jgi:anti-anti-sigma regulatory factor